MITIIKSTAVKQPPPTTSMHQDQLLPAVSLHLRTNETITFTITLPHSNLQLTAQKQQPPCKTSTAVPLTGAHQLTTTIEITFSKFDQISKWKSIGWELRVASSICLWKYLCEHWFFAEPIDYRKFNNLVARSLIPFVVSRKGFFLCKYYCLVVTANCGCLETDTVEFSEKFQSYKGSAPCVTTGFHQKNADKMHMMKPCDV